MSCCYKSITLIIIITGEKCSDRGNSVPVIPLLFLLVICTTSIVFSTLGEHKTHLIFKLKCFKKTAQSHTGYYLCEKAFKHVKWGLPVRKWWRRSTVVSGGSRTVWPTQKTPASSAQHHQDTRIQTEERNDHTRLTSFSKRAGSATCWLVHTWMY